jgi:sialic acid synthase SpsE
MKGPDHSFAIEPHDLRQMIQNIRDVEKSEGDGKKVLSKLEMEMYEKGRRSLIASKQIKKGLKITREMIIIKRPGYGIKPKFLKEVIGKTAKKDIEEDQWITWEDIN